MIRASCIACGIAQGFDAAGDLLLADFRVEYSRGLIVKTRPYPHVPELLGDLLARGALAVLGEAP